MTVQRARTKNVETDDKGHLTTTSRNEMDVKHCE